MYYSDRGSSVLWSAGSAFVVCCLKTTSPLSCVLFLRSAVAGAVPGPGSLWDRGLTWGFSGDADAAVIVLGILSWGGGDTSSFSRVWGNVGVVLGLNFWVVGVARCFSGVWVRVGGLSRMDRALSVAAGGLKSRGADTSF